mgnify:CR=1 FL=1
MFISSRAAAPGTNDHFDITKIKEIENGRMFYVILQLDSPFSEHICIYKYQDFLRQSAVSQLIILASI